MFDEKIKPIEGRCPKGYDFINGYRNKRGIYVRPFCRKHMETNPYGEQKTDAVKQAQILRAEGERVRVEETNEKRKLYAPFVGIKDMQNTKPPSVQTLQKPHKTTETIEIMKEGENPYIAKITGPDQKYHYQREFISQMKTYEGGSRKHPVYKTYFKGDLPYGTIIDTRDRVYMVVPKSSRYPNGLRKIGTESMENRLKMNRLFEARQKSGYYEKINRRGNE